MKGISTPASPPVFDFKASRQPMLWAAIAYSLGLVAGIYLWRPALWWLAAGAAFAAAAAFFVGRRSVVGWLLALGAVFLAGALHIQAHTASKHLDTSIQPYADRQELQITAHVTRDGRVQPGSFNEIRQTIDVETEQVQAEGEASEAIHSSIRLSIYSPRPKDAAAEMSAPVPIFHYGDRIRFPAKLKRRAIFAIPVRLTIGAILPIATSPPWARREWRMWNACLALPAAASHSGEAACIAA